MTPLIAGNWKMNLSRAEVRALLESLKAASGKWDGVDVAVYPPYVYLAEAAEILSGTPIELGAQDLYWEPSGAYTAAISGPMLRDVGCQRVLVGHSERRHVFGESDEETQRKVQAAFANQLQPTLCVGETLDEREAAQTSAVVDRQIRAGLEGCTADQAKRGLTIAYEPVWAIGTGHTATPEQAGEVHRFIRLLLGELFGKDLAAEIPIQYGGSVKPSNIDELMAVDGVDGALVGGASLEAESFVRIVEFQRS
ncbi:MAG: triose-phosphate isomerase [Planctomycetota bacterium]